MSSFSVFQLTELGQLQLVPVDRSSFHGFGLCTGLSTLYIDWWTVHIKRQSCRRIYLLFVVLYYYCERVCSWRERKKKKLVCLRPRGVSDYYRQYDGRIDLAPSKNNERFTTQACTQRHAGKKDDWLCGVNREKTTNKNTLR